MKGMTMRQPVVLLVSLLMQGVGTMANGAPVKLGVDVLFDEGLAALPGPRVGLVTNHTGLDSEGVSTILRLHEDPRVELCALFAPEHGLEGTLDAKVADAVHGATGLRVHSLYGDTRQPAPELFQGLDAVLFDIQDVGARFYTYTSTMSHCMETAGHVGVPFIVLDRPNPIGGLKVEGPVLESELRSFVGLHEIALRHGMTLGELALMFRGEYGIECDLRVVPMQGWERWMYYEDTGLPWARPSPAMPTVDTAVVYPGVCLLERTNVSVGRGTDTPFELFGAPWLRSEELAAELSAVGLPGVEFAAEDFTPTEGARHYGGQRCRGVRVRVTDRDAFESVRTGLYIFAGIRRLNPQDLTVPEGTDHLAGLRAIRLGIEQGRSAVDLEPLLDTGLDAFLAARAKYLLYQ